MATSTCTVTIPKTPEELDQAIQHYKAGTFSSDELYCQWEAIREASLRQAPLESDPNPVPGSDSY